jgi:hypothetical protein
VAGRARKKCSEKEKSKGKRQKAKIEAGDWGLGTGSSSPQAPSLKPQVSSEAEACFLKAVYIARQQQAKFLELRAVMGLVRLRQQQVTQHGPSISHQASRTTHHASRTALADAYNMLSEIYNWFTEGFDTVDLQEARVLLTSNED